MKTPNTLDVHALAKTLGTTHLVALKTGVDDGYEQGFELSMGMTFDDLDAQWAYDTGTYIGACLAVRSKA